MEKHLSFTDILSVYLNEGQLNEFLKSGDDNISSVSFAEEINLLNRQFIVSRRIRIENLITLTEKELPKIKYVDLFLYLSKHSINIGLFHLAEDIIRLLIEKITDIEKLKDYLATAYFNLGEIYFRQGYWKKAESELLKAKRIFQSEKNRNGVFRCENMISAILGEKGDMNKALKNFHKLLGEINPKKEKYLYAMVESNIGILNQALHNFDESVSYLNRALIYFSQIGESARVAEIKYNIANLFYLQKDYAKAVEKIDEAAQAAVAAEHLPFLCLCFVTKADSLLNQNDFKPAAALADLAMDISSRINDRLSIADIYKVKGKIELELQNYDYAENLLLTSLRLNREAENKYNIAETCLSLSRLYKLKKKPKESAKFQILALLYFNEIKMHTYVGQNNS